MNGNTRTGTVWSAAALFCGLALAGCGSASSGVSSGLGTSGGTGTLSVRLADAPIDADKVNVTFSRVEAHVSTADSSQWQTLRSTPMTVDLKTLVLSDTELATAQLPAGHYDQVRLVVSSAEIVQGTNTYVVTVPSGIQSGIKLNVNADVPPNTVTELLLDFNVARSIVATPPGSTNYLLKPVIPAVVKVLSGTITGTVMLDSTTPAANATVEVSQAGVVANTSQTLADGAFKVWALLPGTYDVKITFTNPDGTTVTQTLTAAVVAGQDTALGTVTLAAPAAPSAPATPA
jgi:hypothetical protein